MKAPITLWDYLMKELEAASLLAMAVLIGKLEAGIKGKTFAAAEKPVADSIGHSLDGELYMRTHLLAHEMVVSAGMLDLVRKALNGTDWHEIQAACTQFTNALEIEMRAQTVFTLSAAQSKSYSSGDKALGEIVSAKFAAAKYDIDEAAKCLGLGRSTACVFHLMRIVELGLHAIHRCLGLPTPLVGNDKNWGSILGRVREEIKLRPKNWIEKDFFQEIYALLDAVKDSWRNQTMHIERTYTPEEAEKVMYTVRSFMQRIADRMDEKGEPLA